MRWKWTRISPACAASGFLPAVQARRRCVARETHRCRLWRERSRYIPARDAEWRRLSCCSSRWTTSQSEHRLRHVHRTVRREAIRTRWPRRAARDGARQLGQTGGASLSPGFLVFLRLTRDRAGTAPTASPHGPALCRLPCAANCSRPRSASPAAAGQYRGVRRRGDAGEPAVPVRAVRRRRASATDFVVTREIDRRRTALDGPVSADQPVHAADVARHAGDARPVRAASRRRHRAGGPLSGTRLRRDVELQEATEKSLLEKDLMLQEMKHRIKNSITRVLAIARQTAAAQRTSRVLRLLLGAAAGHGCVSGHADALALAEGRSRRTLRIELGQVFGKELPDGMIVGAAGAARRGDDPGAGPDLPRTRDQCAEIWRSRQSPPNGGAQGDWTVEGTGQRPDAGLNWREPGRRGSKRRSRTGFGTKLIDLNITRELRGTIERDFHADGLSVEIVIPLRR